MTQKFLTGEKVKVKTPAGPWAEGVVKRINFDHKYYLITMPSGGTMAIGFGSMSIRRGNILFRDYPNRPPYSPSHKLFLIDRSCEYSHSKINHVIKMAQDRAVRIGISTVMLNTASGPYLFEYTMPSRTACTVDVFNRIPSQTELKVYLRHKWDY